MTVRAMPSCTSATVTVRASVKLNCCQKMAKDFAAFRHAVSEIFKKIAIFFQVLVDRIRYGHKKNEQLPVFLPVAVTETKKEQSHQPRPAKEVPQEPRPAKELAVQRTEKQPEAPTENPETRTKSEPEETAPPPSEPVVELVAESSPAPEVTLPPLVLSPPLHTHVPLPLSPAASQMTVKFPTSAELEKLKKAVDSINWGPFPIMKDVLVAAPSQVPGFGFETKNTLKMPKAFSLTLPDLVPSFPTDMLAKMQAATNTIKSVTDALKLDVDTSTAKLKPDNPFLATNTLQSVAKLFEKLEAKAPLALPSTTQDEAKPKSLEDSKKLSPEQLKAVMAAIALGASMAKMAGTIGINTKLANSIQAMGAPPKGLSQPTIDEVD